MSDYKRDPEVNVKTFAKLTAAFGELEKNFPDIFGCTVPGHSLTVEGASDGSYRYWQKNPAGECDYASIFRSTGSGTRSMYFEGAEDHHKQGLAVLHLTGIPIQREAMEKLALLAYMFRQVGFRSYMEEYPDDGRMKPFLLVDFSDPEVGAKFDAFSKLTKDTFGNDARSRYDAVLETESDRLFKEASRNFQLDKVGEHLTRVAAELAERNSKAASKLVANVTLQVVTAALALKPN